jgi:hypothetical protein
MLIMMSGPASSKEASARNTIEEDEDEDEAEDDADEESEGQARRPSNGKIRNKSKKHIGPSKVIKRATAAPTPGCSRCRKNPKGCYPSCPKYAGHGGPCCALRAMEF